MNGRLRSTMRAQRVAEAATVTAVVEAWELMVADEQARGRRVAFDGPAAKAFMMHLAGELDVTRTAAASLLHLGLRLQHDLPRTHARFVAGDCGIRTVRMVASAAEGIDRERLDWFDAQASAHVTGLAPKRLNDRLDRLRIQADTAAAAARERLATAAREVSFWAEDDDQAVMQLRGPQTDIAAIHDALRQAAVAAHGVEGNTRTLSTLMYDAAAEVLVKSLLDLPIAPRDPGAPESRVGLPTEIRLDTRRPKLKGKPIQARLLVILPADTACGEGDEPGTLAGWGPITAPTARRITAVTAKWTRVTVDPVDNVLIGVDSHSRYIDSQLSAALLAMDQTCRGPGCGTPGHQCDIDHVRRREHDGVDIAREPPPGVPQRPSDEGRRLRAGRREPRRQPHLGDPLARHLHEQAGHPHRATADRTRSAAVLMWRASAWSAHSAHSPCRVT